ncbi:MAG: LytTR family DNA-binding domain-containing protein [Microscillaceae bacterium]
MTKIRTLLVDDEPLAGQELAFLLQDFDFVEIIGICHDWEEARQSILNLRPDLVFLDIELGAKNAFDLLESLDQSPEVIFTTAYNQYALQAFEANALDYLLKPIVPERLQKSLDKVQSFLPTRPSLEPNPSLTLDSKVFIKDGEACFFVSLTEIFLFESVGNYVRVFFKEHRPFLKKSLNQLEERLPAPHFFRINRHQIINLAHVREVNLSFKNRLVVHVGPKSIEAEVSARQSARFRELLSL